MSSLTQGLNLLFLNVLFQHIPSLEAFQEIAFIYGFPWFPRDWTISFWQSLKPGATLGAKRRVRQVSNASHPIRSSGLVETFQIDALGELLVGGIYSDNSIKHCLDSSKFPAFSSLVFLLRPWFILRKSRQPASLWTKQSRRYDLHFYMFNDFAKYPISFTIRFFVGWLALSSLSLLRPTILPAISCRTRMCSLAYQWFDSNFPLIFFVISLKLWDEA